MRLQTKCVLAYQERKALLKERYGVEVTPGLVEKDDVGWYPQLRLHYFLTLGREHLAVRLAALLELRDAKRAKSQIETGGNPVWKPDFNRGQLLPWLPDRTIEMLAR